MKTTTPTLLSLRIRQLRKENGLLQSELAARLGVTTSNISNYENGRNSPPIEKIQELSEIFRVPIDYLTGESDSRSYKDSKKFIEIDNYIGDLLRELSKSENTFKYNGFPVTLEAKEVLRHNLEHTLQILQIQQSKFFNNPTED